MPPRDDQPPSDLLPPAPEWEPPPDLVEPGEMGCKFANYLKWVSAFRAAAEKLARIADDLHYLGRPDTQRLRGELAAAVDRAAREAERASLAEGREDALRKYLAARERASVATFAPGEKVTLTACSRKWTGVVDEVRLGPNDSVRYLVTYWSEASRYEILVRPDEITTVADVLRHPTEPTESEL